MTRPTMNQSDDAVRDATGRTWSEWEAVLDEAGVEGLSHKEIVAWLEEHGGIESGWWRQSVAVGYEKLKGKRVVGQTADGTFQIGVTRTLPMDHHSAWALLTSPEGVRAWLGDVGHQGGEGSEGSEGGGGGLRLEEGATWASADGGRGEVRVVRPGSHARVTRDPGGWDRPSTIQIRVESKGDRTVVGFHEENLPAQRHRNERRAHYRAALDRLEALAGDGS